MPPRRRPVSLRVRTLAGVLDSAGMLVPMGLLAAAAQAAHLSPPKWLTDRLLSRPTRVILEGGGRLIALRFRSLSLGQWILGIRTVDARTGGPVTVRGSLTEWAIPFVVLRGSRAALAPRAGPLRRQAERWARQSTIDPTGETAPATAPSDQDIENRVAASS